MQRVYAFCLTHSATREEAEDFTAQTFERALTAMPRYEDHGAPLSSWLFRIAANAAIDRGRRGGRLRILSSDHEAEEQVRRVPMEQSGPDQVVERWEAALWIHTRLAALPSDQRRTETDLRALFTPTGGQGTVRRVDVVQVLAPGAHGRTYLVPAYRFGGTAHLAGGAASAAGGMNAT